MKKVSLIGCTGSIGGQVLKVVKNYPDRFKICALAANSDSEEFGRLVREFKPLRYAAALSDKEEALSCAEAEDADIVFNAAGGFAGLEYSLRAINAGKTLALANKETLVCGGEKVIAEARKKGVEIIPVDSEHSAIWQCLNFDKKAKVRRLLITASGGAFRGYPPERLKNVTPAEALRHPTWKMGKKITVDSATLVNKGYEVIEAHVLYGVPYKDIQAVIQPQSLVHSMAEFDDGAILAQMSYPTMELPIQLALTYPQRLPCTFPPMDFTKPFSVDFEPLERKKFPFFDIALRCGEEGGTLPCILNAADEVAVEAFLEGKIGFTDMYAVLEGTLSSTRNTRAESFEELCEADKKARADAERIVLRLM